VLTLLVCIRLWHCSDVPFFTTVIAYSLSYPYGISEQKCELMLLDLHCYLNVIGPSRQMLTKAKVKVPCFKEGLMGEDPFLSYTFQLAMDKSRRTHGQCVKRLALSSYRKMVTCASNSFAWGLWHLFANER